MRDRPSVPPLPERRITGVTRSSRQRLPRRQVLAAGMLVRRAIKGLRRQGTIHTVRWLAFRRLENLKWGGHSRRPLHTRWVTTILVTRAPVTAGRVMALRGMAAEATTPTRW